MWILLRIYDFIVRQAGSVKTWRGLCLLAVVAFVAGDMYEDFYYMRNPSDPSYSEYALLRFSAKWVTIFSAIFIISNMFARYLRKRDMKFPEFMVGQVNPKSLCLLFAKFLIILFLFSELRDEVHYITCGVIFGNLLPLLIHLFIKWGIIFIILFRCYRIVLYFQKKGTLKSAFAYFAVLSIVTLQINGSVFGIYYWDGPYWGRVVDADTGEGIAGAHVAGMWEMNIVTLLLTNHFADARETVTDGRGYFFLPPARVFWLWPFSWISLESLNVFRPGYDSNPPRMYKVWSDADKERWRTKLKPKIWEYYHYSVPVSDRYEKYSVRKMIEEGRAERYYSELFRKYGGNCEIYKPTVVRLNKAESAEEQRMVTNISLRDIDFSFCEMYKVRRMTDALNREKERLRGTLSERY